MDIPSFEDKHMEQEQGLQVKAFQDDDQQGNPDKISWQTLSLRSQLLEALKKVGYTYPSQIQAMSLPYIFQEKDIICQARSGTGKTAVFVLGVLNQLNCDRLDRNICIVVAPTRQLAHQINKSFRFLSQKMLNRKIRIGCFFGGIDMNMHRMQITGQQTYPHIMIASPGRLQHLSKQKLIQFDKCKYFVLDQCDILMKNLSMKRNIMNVFKKLPQNKQVMLISATIPDQIKSDLKRMTRQYVQICAVNNNHINLTGLKQFYVSIDEEAHKIPKLIELLDNTCFDQIIIFVNRVHRAQKLTEILKSKLFNPICIHSAMSQQQRLISYDGFKKNKYKILVATDLFGRGIDIDNVNFIINYDFPYDIETYLHRIGRAGRFGGKGIAISFLNDQQQYRQGDTFGKIQANLEKQIQLLPNNFTAEQFLK